MLVRVTLVVWCAVTVTHTGADPAWRLDTWYRPAGSWTENTPELVVRTATGW